MATFRNDSDTDLTIDRFGLYIPAGATFEIPDVDADSLGGAASIVRVASDVPAEVPLPVEVVRDLVDVAGYSPTDLDETAEPAPASDADVADAGADVPDAAPDGAEAPSAGTDVADPDADVAPEISDAPSVPTEDAPVLVDEDPAAGALDSFTQS